MRKRGPAELAGSASDALGKEKRLRGRILRPDQAAAIKRRQQLEKKAVRRRVALWRSRTVDGKWQTVYITLAGDVLKKGARAYRAAAADQQYLKACGIASNQPAYSEIEVPEEIHPYASCRGQNPLELAYWCIPQSVQACLRAAGIQHLHKWQAECLSCPQVLVAGQSLVYVAPTSAGKSLVSEVLMLRQLLFHGRRALLILPFVSICVEKVSKLRQAFGACGLRVEGLYSASDGKWHAGADVAVCTIEKASALLNRLLEEDALLRDIGVIVVDEMHLLGEEHRGYLLELILVKARLSAAMAADAGGSAGLQIVGMSATLPNVRLLADWLGARLYVSEDRPVPLSLSVAMKGQVLHQGSSLQASRPLSRNNRDPDGLVPLVWECVSMQQSVLVFCATKDWCEKAAALLADEMPRLDQLEKENSGHTNAYQQGQGQRLQLVEELKQTHSGLCPILARTVLNGVAYHHAGLTTDERGLLEAAYRKGVLRCLCATSTLAAGVNLPARRVIIRSMKVGRDPLDAVRFRQMAGRAGRVGFDTEGECIVMARTMKEADEARALFAAQLQPLRSALGKERLVRAALEVISLGLVRTVEELEVRFARKLFRCCEEWSSTCSSPAVMAVPASLLQDLRSALCSLKAQQLVEVDDPHGYPSIASSEPESQGTEVYSPQATIRSTPLGNGIVHSALKPEEALSVFSDLQRARKCLCLDNDLHLIFLATPAASVTIEPDWARYLSYYERLQSRDRAVSEAVGVSHHFLLKQSMGHRGPLPGSSGDWRQDRERVTALHRRFWAALALRELAAENPPARVACAFAASRGSLQALQGIAATYCGMVRQLCERVHWNDMAALFDCLMPRLNFGAATEALPLCRIPGVHCARARALLQVGLSKVEEVAQSPVSMVESALKKLCQLDPCEPSAAHHQEAVIREAAARIIQGAQQQINAELQRMQDETEEARARFFRKGPGWTQSSA